jgi:hypothetical protein
MGDRTHPGVAADSRRSTDLIQAIRVPVGRGVVAAAVGAGAGAGPMYLFDPDLGRRRQVRIVGAPLSLPMLCESCTS